MQAASKFLRIRTPFSPSKPLLIEPETARRQARPAPDGQRLPRYRHFTDENAVGVRNMLLTLARIGPSRSLSARAEIHAGSAWNAVHFFSRSASDSQAIR